LSPPAIHNPFFHVGFIVPDLDAAMKEFQAALGIAWRAPVDAMVPLLGPDGVIESNVYSVYSQGGPPAIELVQSVPGTPLAGNGGVSFHHLGFWTDRLATSSHDLDAHGWPCAATVASVENQPSRFTLQQSPTEGYFLRRDAMQWFWDQYTTDENQRNEITASPVRAAANDLAGLPNALVITGEADVLRDEGEAYGRKLREAGVDVTAIRYEGIIHDFVMLNALRGTNAASAAIAQAIAYLRNALT
jgi:hypothetical protein